MTVVILKRSMIPCCDDAPRGSWWTSAEQPFLVSIKCPECGHCMTLAHAVQPDGTLHPDVECLSGICRWKATVRIN